jgi:two-component system, LytTR family, response regulator
MNFSAQPIYTSDMPQLYKRDKITIREGKIIHLIDINQIIMIEGQSNYSAIYFQDKCILLSKTLKYWQDKLIDTPLIRIHKTYIINPKHINSVDTNQRVATLSNGHQVRISRAVNVRQLVEQV